MKKKLFVLLLSIISVVCLAFGVSACSKTKTDDVAVTSVSISTTEISLEVGESYTLSATILPSNATNTNVTWSSSATSVATVSGGKVTAISEGTAIITVTTTDGGYTDTCTVTVTERQETPSTVSVTSVSLSETSLSLEAGGTYTLTATVLPSNATDKTVSWSSSDESVATVNNGVITAVAAGTATITVTTTDGNYTATCELTINEEPATVAVTSVALDKSTLTLMVDDTYTLTATILPSNATNQNITWASSDSTVATVLNGVITAVSAGTATITVTTEDGNFTDTCTVTVEETSTHIHNYTSVVTDPTCTEQGYTTYTCECGDSYTDDYIDAIGHTNAEAVTENYVVATCMADGSYDLVVYCSVCSAEISRETITIPATGHTNAEAVTENYVAATCTTDGSYDLVVYCSVCGAEISRENITIPATGHTNAEAVTENYVAATCTADGFYDLVVYCSVCGVEISRETITIPATNHDYVATVTEPTCTEQGYTTHTCSVCGESYTDDETEALGHNYELSSWTWDGYTSATATFTCANDKSHEESITATITDKITTSPTCTETGIKTYTATVMFDGKTYSDTTTDVIAATEHTEAEAVTENYVAATCTEDGSYDLVVYCSVCSAEISRETIIIPATSHSYESVVTAPTCTEDGYITHTCSVCGDSYTDSETQATGHIWDEGEVTTEPTCTETGVKTYTCTACGETKTETIVATGHTESESVRENYIAATCTEDGSYDLVVYCSVCGAEISRETVTIPATGHTASEAVTENYIAATCTEDGSYDLVVYCSVCGEEISRETITIPATGHSYESVVTDPTCTEQGYTTHTCSVCRDTYTDNYVDATGHSWNEGEVTTEPTCTETGVKTYTCTACGETKTETIAATGHTESEAVKENEVEATCTEDGSYDLVVYCSVCGEEISRETITTPAMGHTESEAVKENEVEATCTEDGSYDLVVYCSVCDEEISREVITIPAMGHMESEAVKENEVEATCTEDGSYDLVVYCSVCGEELSREVITIPATGHSYESIVTDPTCTESGYTSHTCSVCGDTYIDNETEAMGHSWNDGEVTTEPTCTETGVRTYTCATCGETKTETIAATGHTEAEAVIENYVAETDTENGSYDLVVYCSVCGAEISRETVVIYAISVTLSETTVEIEKGDTYTLTATVTTNGVTSSDVTWVSSNKNVITVTDGELTAVSIGTATITAISSDGNHTATCTVTVTAIKAEITNVDGGTIDGENIYMFVDSSTQSLSLSSKITCGNNCSWKLYSSDGVTNIPTKMLTSLADGNNTYYIIVTSTKDSTVESYYTLTVYKSYAISVYFYNGSTLLYTDSAYTGYEYSADYTPSITGYTFNYWAYSDGTIYTAETLWGNLKLYVNKTANNYTVTYDTNEGCMNDNQITVTYDSSYTFAVPERIGYTFNGWYYADTQLTNENGESLSIWSYTENITVTAKWTANEYTITLVLSDENAGAVTGGGNYAFDSEVTISATTNAGYTWAGWYLNDELATAETVLTFTMEFAATYTATWTANKYEVTLELSDGNAGTVSGEGSHTYNTQVTISVATNAGYTWVGWYLNGELVSEEAEYTFTMGFAVTYTATWTANEYEVTLELSDNSAGSVTGDGTYTYNTSVTISATTNSGYTWVGWYLNSELVSEEAEYTFTMGFDATYTATWKANDYTINLVLSDENAGTVTGGGSYDYNSEVTISATTNTGYTWIGWYSNGELVSDEAEYTFTMDFGSTYTATWTANDYEVTLKLSDDSAGSVTGDGTYTYNTSVTISATTNSGYTWVGWYDSTGNFVTDEIEYTFTMGLDCLYTAAYSKINVTITYSGAGTITSLDSTYTVGESVKVTASEANLGYTWVGWYDKNGKLLTNDYTYSFSMPSASNTYTATYTLNSEIAGFNFTSTTTTCTITGILDSSATNIVIPDYVTAIAGSAFSGGDSLTSITIGSGVTSIGTYAFENCTAEIIWSDDIAITNIGSYAFANYTGASISIPDSVTSIGTYAFYCCASEIIWGNNIAITEIGRYAFAYYAGTSVTIPDSVTSIGDYAFRYCTSLTSVYYSGTVSQWASISFGDSTANPLYYAGNLYINNILLTDLKDTDITSISAYAFVGWNVSTITVPDSVTSIGESAFGGCSSLISITLPFVGSSVSATSASSSTLFGYIFGTSSYTGGTSTKQYYARSSYKTYYIPATLTTVTITGGNILSYAFYGCSNLTNIIIPDSVTSIGSYVFYGCTALTSIAIPDSVTSIGSYVFYGCTALTSIAIPDSVTSIGNYTFYNCSSLTSITIPNSVTSIYGSTFYGCTSLTSITIPNSVTSIYGSTFYGCTSLTSVTIPDSVTSIGTYAFYNCSSLTNVTIGDSVTSIGTYAFYNCTALTEINFNATAMEDLSSSNYVFYCAGQSGGGITVTIGANVTKIPAYLFYPYPSSSYTPYTTSVVFEGNSVCESIGSYAFAYYAGISITIPDSVTSIGTYAFYNCTALTSVTIGESVASIGTYAFYNCTALTKINFNATAMNDLSEDNYVFYCAGQSGGGITVTIGANVTKIPAYLFFPYSSSSYTSPYITSVVFEDNSVCESIGSYAFRGCTSLTSVTIPDSVTSIGTYAFYNCRSLTNVTIGDSVTSIGSHAFYNCTKLTNVTIPDSVTSIGTYTFYNCTSLTSITIGDSVTSIGSGAFYGCTALTNLSIGNNVTSIGNSAFEDCTALTEIYFNATAMDDLSENNYVFYYAGQSGNGITVTIGASVISIPAYLFNPYYLNGDYSVNIISVIFEDGCGCTSIGEYAFLNCATLQDVYISDLVAWCKISFGNVSANPLCQSCNLYLNGGLVTELEIPESITTINNCAFCGCASLTSITIGDSVTSIGNYAFRGCTSLTSITIPDSVTSIGTYAFYNCRSLTNVTIGDSVTSIGSYAFYGCTSLTSVTIGDGVTSIGSYSFSGCTSLTSITIPDSVTSIGSSVFYGCSSLTSITLPFVGSSLNETKASDSTLFGYIFGTSSYDGSTAIDQYYSSSSYKTYYIPTTLTTVTITGGDILYGAFYGCIKLTNVTIDGDVISIGSYAFYGCTNLASVTIGDCVTSIGSYAFNGCSSSSLTSVYYSGTASEWASISFGNCAANPLYYAGNLYISNVLLTDLESTNITKISAYTFARWNVTSITIPDSVTSIGSYAFYGCTSLTGITIPDSVTSIGSYAFYGCTSLTGITIPDRVTSIGSYAFRGCTSLTSVTIGTGVASIGKYAFYNCTALTELVYNTTAVADLSSNNYVFYCAGQSGSGITVTIGANVTKIPNYLFCPSLVYSDYAPKITRVVFEEESVCTSIGKYAFFNCTSLTSVTFENTSGWYVTTTEGASNGTDISSSSLSNTSTAATYLKSTYDYYYWYRSE